MGLTLPEYIEHQTKKLQVRYMDVRLFGVCELSISVWSNGSSAMQYGDVMEEDRLLQVEEFKGSVHAPGQYNGARIHHWVRRPHGRKTHHAFVDLIYC